MTFLVGFYTRFAIQCGENWESARWEETLPQIAFPNVILLLSNDPHCFQSETYIFYVAHLGTMEYMKDPNMNQDKNFSNILTLFS